MRRSTLLPLLIAALLPLALAVKYPICPLTGKPPVAPRTAPARCLDAAKMSCCQDCADTSYALQLLNANASALVTQIYPDLATMLPMDPSVQVCNIFSGQEQCSLLVESILCATTCNPDGGSYVTGTAAAPILHLCDEMAQRTYAACSGLSLSDFQMSAFITDAPTFMQMVVANVVQVVGVKNFNITVVPGKAKCFNGPKRMPLITSCCDPLSPSATCPPGVVDRVRYATVIGKKPDPSYCNLTAIDELKKQQQQQGGKGGKKGGPAGQDGTAYTPLPTGSSTTSPAAPAASTTAAHSAAGESVRVAVASVISAVALAAVAML
eukprot:TRINITY_DN10156_c0_g1_i1.p1 TRINITY_DN10156_c0_g1~~TRINITY_DN10156_c0_g1_i1.p1  ORF type:complete len:323 (-),score=-1.39 TRINITY_DN10156_c0_g1_i1:412-1380(-)